MRQHLFGVVHRDWKTAALLRAMKVMAQGLEGGTSFMEDYTNHFTENTDSAENKTSRKLITINWKNCFMMRGIVCKI